jgi:hypothetical protein
MEMTVYGALFQRCVRTVGADGFWWQQDNAPAHGPAGEIIREYFNMTNWPPHSPDLSPMEMVWSTIKRKLTGERFRTADGLFSAFERT